MGERVRHEIPAQGVNRVEHQYDVQKEHDRRQHPIAVNEALELIEREIPEPGAATVRIKAQACGVYHSDRVTRRGCVPSIAYLQVPSREIIGIVDAVGPVSPEEP